MDYMWYLAGYVGLAYLADWMVDRIWWWYVDRVLEGDLRRNASTTSAKGRVPVNSRAGVRNSRINKAFRRRRTLPNSRLAIGMERH